jgi:hypothetical protein
LAFGPFSKSSEWPFVRPYRPQRLCLGLEILRPLGHAQPRPWPLFRSVAATMRERPRQGSYGRPPKSRAGKFHDGPTRCRNGQLLCSPGVLSLLTAFVNKAGLTPCRTTVWPQYHLRGHYTIPPSSPVYNVTYVTQTTTSSGTNRTASLASPVPGTDANYFLLVGHVSWCKWQRKFRGPNGANRAPGSIRSCHHFPAENPRPTGVQNPRFRSGFWGSTNCKGN